MIPQVGREKRKWKEAHKISIEIEQIFSLQNRSVSVACKTPQRKSVFRKYCAFSRIKMLFNGLVTDSQSKICKKESRLYVWGRLS